MLDVSGADVGYQMLDVGVAATESYEEIPE
jgi:hypothetical protein